MPAPAPAKQHRVGNTTRLAQQSRLEIQRLERADRRWVVWAKKQMVDFEKNSEGDPKELWFAHLKAATDLMDRQPPGYQERRRKCVRCGSAATYSDKYDARFCGQCNRWLEAACADPSCPYCGRPKRPLPRKAGK